MKITNACDFENIVPAEMEKILIVFYLTCGLGIRKQKFLINTPYKTEIFYKI